MEIISKKDGSGLEINWDRSTGLLIDSVEDELKDPTEICFAHLSAQFALGQIDLDKYLYGVLSHLKESQQARHKFDVSPEFMDLEFHLWPLLCSDVFAGSVKGLMWSPSFKLLGDKEWDSLLGLARLVWTRDEPSSVLDVAREQGIGLSCLSSESVDLLLVICYCRRHVRLLEYLIKTVPAPAESCFDRFSSLVVRSRISPQSRASQHSPKTPENVSIEARLWTLLLNSGWIHSPATGRLAMELVAVGSTCSSGDDWSIDFSSPLLDDFHAALGSRKITPSLSGIGSFLSRCPSIEMAQRYFTHFPGDVISSGPTFYSAHTGNLLVPLVESKSLSQKSRLDYVRLLLNEIKDLDINSTIDRPWAADLRRFGRAGNPEDFFNPLLAAGWRGDQEMAHLLLSHGAQVDRKDVLSNLDAGGLARHQGHLEFADWFESLKVA